MINVIIVAGKKTPLRKHIHFVQFHQMCVASRIRDELGRLSLKLQMAMDIFTFWSLLENQPPNFT